MQAEVLTDPSEPRAQPPVEETGKREPAKSAEPPASLQTPEPTPAKATAEESDARDQVAPGPPVYKPTTKEIEAAEQRIALRQINAELVVAYKYRIRSQIPGLMRQLAAVAPESAELRYFEALQLYEEGERGRALIRLEEGLTRHPLFSRAWNLHGIILSEAERMPEARASFEKAVAASPYSPNYVFNLASATYRLGDIQGALEIVDRAVALKPNLSEGYYLQGRIYRDLGQFGPALLAFHEASRYGEDGQVFLLDYMLVAEAAGDEKTVPDLADKLARTRDPRTLRELARVHGKYGEFKIAAGYLSTLVKLPEARPEDRRHFVYALHKSQANVQYYIQHRIGTVKDEERAALLEYHRGLRNDDRKTPGTRDPMLKPIK